MVTAWTGSGRPPRVVWLMADDESDVVLRNVSPDRAPFIDRYVLASSDLGLSPKLDARLQQWREKRPGLTPDEAPARESWFRDGWELAGLLQHELDRLGYDTDVVYTDDGPLRSVHPTAHAVHRLDSTGPTVLVMADYGCFLWTDSPQLSRYRDEDSKLDPARLGVSPGLVEDFTVWHREWEDSAYGGALPPTGDDDSWDRRGIELARRLQDELGSAAEVWFSGDGAGGIGRPVWELVRD